MSKKTSKKKTTSNQEEAKKDFEEGMFFFNMRDVNNALQYFLKAVEKDPNYIEAWKRLVWLHQLRQDFQKVLDILEKLTELDPHDQNSAENLLVHILKVYKKDEDKSAGLSRLNNWLNTTFQKMNKDAKICHLIGSVCNVFEDYESAVKYYEIALKLEPNDAETLQLLNKAKSKLKK